MSGSCVIFLGAKKPWKAFLSLVLFFVNVVAGRFKTMMAKRIMKSIKMAKTNATTTAKGLPHSFWQKALSLKNDSIVQCLYFQIVCFQK